MKKTEKEIIEDKVDKIWDLIFNWSDSDPGEESTKAAKKIDRVLRKLIKNGK